MNLNCLSMIKKVLRVRENINFGRVLILLLCFIIVGQVYFVTYSYAEPQANANDNQEWIWIYSSDEAGNLYARYKNTNSIELMIALNPKKFGTGWYYTQDYSDSNWLWSNNGKIIFNNHKYPPNNNIYTNTTIVPKNTILQPYHNSHFYQGYVALGVVSKNGGGTRASMYIPHDKTIKISDYLNKEPNISIISALENEYFGKKEGHNNILLEGKVNDDDIGDEITVKYTLHHIDSATNLAGHTDVEIFNVSTSDGTDKSFNYSITVDETIPSGKYELRIIAQDDKGGKGERIIPITIDNTPPQTNAPSVNAVSDIEIEITPNSTDTSGLNATETYIYNKNDEDISGWVADTSYLDTELTANTQYTYKYKAKDILDNESEYSPTANVYTKALNPESIVITDNGGISLTFEITNTVQGQVPEHRLELKLKGAGASGANAAVSDWSMETIRELTGLSIETDYELWVTTRNGDKVENDKYLALGSFITNTAPIIDILSPDNQILSEKSGYNEFIVEGTIQDSDVGDNITVYYSIEDNAGSLVEEHAIKSIASLSADGNIQSFNNYPITIDSRLPEGDYTIRIWCEDDRTGKSNEIAKNFKIDKASPTVNVPTVSTISDTEIQITPDASDPSNLHTTPYLYNRDNTDISSWIDKNPYLDTGLTANTQYTYKYKAKDRVDNESEYSPTAKIYTKALNPESILITDSSGTSLTFEITNAIQGQVPEHRLELKLKGAGMSGDNVAFSDWSIETTRELTGLEKFTEYELWVTTRNSDKVENDKYLALNSFTTNIPPSLSITTAEGDINLNYNGTFELEGAVSDSDNDTVEITAVIGEIEKTISIDTLENSNWSLSWKGSELKSGLFEGITINADDGKGGSDTKKWNGSIAINPYIRLNGNNLVEIERENRFIDPGASSNYSVKVTGTVDTSKLGTYVLTYEAENPVGTVARANRTIVVIKNLKDRIRDKIDDINKELDDLENTKESNLPRDIEDLNKSIDELEDQINELPEGKEKDDFIDELEKIKERRDKLQEKVNNKDYFEDKIDKIYIDFERDP
ncbi:immunoglobulin-like domain-containing protein, partial [Maledivibacter halophilus]